MARSKKKYNERLNLGAAADGSYVRKWIRADSKAEFETLKRKAYSDFESIKLYAPIRFGGYADKWFETYKSNRSIQTRQMYDNAINKLDPIRNKLLGEVTATDLQQIIQQNWKHARVCEIIKLTLKQIYKCAIRDRLVEPINLAETLEIPKKIQKQMRTITDAEMEKILKCNFKPEDRKYIDVLRHTGMRPSEALALDWSDIDIDQKVIHVRRSFEFKDNNIPQIKPTKTNRERDIPLNSCLASVLILARQAKGYVFVREDGSPYTKSAYTKMSYRIFNLITEAIGENDLVMYSFRHTFATFLYYNGCRPGLISTKKAAQIMGHSEKIFLERYTHIDDSQEHVAEIMEKLSE